MDAIDNSAGVDCSDHEVNIKILVDAIVRGGDMTEKQRNELLASMTDEVGDLVLRDNPYRDPGHRTRLSPSRTPWWTCTSLINMFARAGRPRPRVLARREELGERRSDN